VLPLSAVPAAGRRGHLSPIVISLLAFNLRIEPADLRNPVITVFPDEPGERDHATGISGDGRSSSLYAEAAVEDIDAPER
jgi:hypothetical protein